MESCGWHPWVLTSRAEGPLPVGIPASQVIRLGRHPQAADPRPGAGQNDAIRIPDSPRRGLSPLVEGGRRTIAAAGIRLRAVDCTCFTWFSAVLRRQEVLARRLPPIDLVLGTFGPAAALWLARRLATKFNVPWVADFRDLAALGTQGRNRPSQWLDRQLERRLLRSAAAITTVSPTLAAVLEETYGCPTEVVYNGWNDATPSGDCPNFCEVKMGLSPLGCPSHLGHRFAMPQPPSTVQPPFLNVPYLYYAGRWYPERVRAGRLVLEALVGRPDVHWLVRSLGPAAAEREIQSEAARLGIAGRVHLRPPCHPDQVSREADGSLANLVLGEVDPRERCSRGTLTGKLLELVAAAGPVLAVTRADSDMGPILRQTGKGAVCPDAPSLARLVGRLQREPSTYQGDRQAIDSFSKSRQAAVLCRLLNRITASRSLRKAS
jgi:hypothetical protein